MPSRTHQTAALIGALCLLVAGGVYLLVRPEEARQDGERELWVEGRPGTTLHRARYEVPAESATALGVLRLAAERAGFQVEMRETSLGPIVSSVAGVREGQNCYWWFQVDGKDGDQGAEKTVVPPGSTVRWFLSCF